MININIEKFVIILFISLLVSLFISFLYLTFYRNKTTGSQIHRAFPLLGVSITTIFICIQFSLPLSLGLLGALSIVRFRTPIKEPEEIGFIMLVIAASICCATFNWVFLGVLLFVTFIGLILLKHGPRFLLRKYHDGILLINLPTSEYNHLHDQLTEFLKSRFPGGETESIIENDEESVISFSFSNINQSKLPALQSDLKNISDKIKSNIFFNKPNTI